MTRILVQRGGSGSCASSSNPSQSRPTHVPAPPPAPVDDNASESPNEPQVSQEIFETAASQESFPSENEEKSAENVGSDLEAKFGEEKASSSISFSPGKILDHTSEPGDLEASVYGFSSGSAFLEEGSSHMVNVCPPPPPVPPPKPTTGLSSRRIVSAGSSTPKSSPSRRNLWTVSPSRSSPTRSRPSSPRSIGEEGYNSADEQSPCYNSYYGDAERERQFEIDISCSKGLEVRKMVADGNCLFRAVADQVYGDPEVYDDTRQMCFDYMEKERDHFSPFVTESFIAYCKRKRRDKVYGNNLEIQAMSEMYNRPIHIYSYSTEPINIFHGNYTTDSPPIRLSYHRGNHYNSLVDPHHLTVGAGLGFGSLHGKNIDKDQVKAAIKAQQDQQIENALMAEGRFYSDLELTQQELERVVMEASRNEYKQQYGHKASCTTTNAEPSSSASITGPSREDYYGPFRDFSFYDDVGIPTSVQTVASMGFDHIKVLEAHSIFNDDVEAMVCYLLETSASSPGGESYYRLKGKAAQK